MFFVFLMDHIYIACHWNIFVFDQNNPFLVAVVNSCYFASLGHHVKLNPV